MSRWEGIHLTDSGPRSGRSTVVCLHGIGSSSKAFVAQLRDFPPRARVVAWDAPGYGESPDPDGPLALADYVAAIANIVERIGGGPVHVLGTSWGGVLACAFALEHAELVSGLILADASAGSGGDDQQAGRMRARARQLAEAGVAEFSRQRAPTLVSPDATPELVAEITETMRAAIRLPGYEYAAETMASTDLRPQLHQVRPPALVLCGDRDDVTGPAHSQVLAGGIPHAVMVTLRGAGHAANQEKAASFNDWVLAFLDIAESQHG
jgi:3-oxoadipate enol-lactonase